MSTFHNQLTQRRSIRKYSSRTIESEKIDMIIRAALMSPTSKSRNPWEFLVIDQKEILQLLSVARPHGAQFLADASVGIVVIADMQKSDVWIEDASIAALVIQLQAQDLGIGSCWIQIHQRKKNDTISSEAYVRELLAIPEQYAVICIISLGYPNESKAPFSEEKMDLNKVHYNHFGHK